MQRLLTPTRWLRIPVRLLRIPTRSLGVHIRLCRLDALSPAWLTAISHSYKNSTHVSLRLTSPPPIIVQMQYHQYSKLFTSGLLSDPSPPPPRVSGPRLRRGRALFLNQTNPESSEPTDSRTYSFLKLADPLASPVSLTDPSFAWRSLGHHTIPYVLSRVFARRLSISDALVFRFIQCHSQSHQENRANPHAQERPQVRCAQPPLRFLAPIIHRPRRSILPHDRPTTPRLTDARP